VDNFRGQPHALSLLSDALLLHLEDQFFRLVFVDVLLQHSTDLLPLLTVKPVRDCPRDLVDIKSQSLAEPVVQRVIGYNRLDSMLSKGRLLSFVPNHRHILPRSFFLLLLRKVVAQGKRHWHRHMLFSFIGCCKRLINAIAVLLAIWLPFKLIIRSYILVDMRMLE